MVRREFQASIEDNLMMKMDTFESFEAIFKFKVFASTASPRHFFGLKSKKILPKSIHITSASVNPSKRVESNEEKSSNN